MTPATTPCWLPSQWPSPHYNNPSHYHPSFTMSIPSPSPSPSLITLYSSPLTPPSLITVTHHPSLTHHPSPILHHPSWASYHSGFSTTCCWPSGPFMTKSFVPRKQPHVSILHHSLVSPNNAQNTLYLWPKIRWDEIPWWNEKGWVELSGIWLELNKKKRNEWRWMTTHMFSLVLLSNAFCVNAGFLKRNFPVETNCHPQILDGKRVVMALMVTFHWPVVGVPSGWVVFVDLSVLCCSSFFVGFFKERLHCGHDDEWVIPDAWEDEMNVVLLVIVIGDHALGDGMVIVMAIVMVTSHDDEWQWCDGHAHGDDDDDTDGNGEVMLTVMVTVMAMVMVWWQWWVYGNDDSANMKCMLPVASHWRSSTTLTTQNPYLFMKSR